MVSAGNLFPNIPSAATTSKVLTTLIEKCCEFDPDLRPSFDWICDYLKKHHHSLSTITAKATSPTNWQATVPSSSDYHNLTTKTTTLQPSSPREYANNVATSEHEYVSTQATNESMDAINEYVNDPNRNVVAKFSTSPEEPISEYVTLPANNQV
jgi:serine/threonine protein kinase